MLVLFDERSLRIVYRHFHFGTLGRGLFHIVVHHGTGRLIGAIEQVQAAAGTTTETEAASYTIGIHRLEEVEALLGHLIAQLVQHSQVIYHPEATALGGSDQVVILNSQVGNGYDRQVHLERLPALTIIERYIHTTLSTSIQQALFLRISPYHAGKVIVWNTISDLGPGFAIVLGLVQVRLVVAHFVLSTGYIGTTLYERVSINAVDHQVGRHVGRGHIIPVFTTITGHMHQTIIRAGPDQVFLVRRLSGGKYRSVVLY